MARRRLPARARTARPREDPDVPVRETTHRTRDIQPGSRRRRPALQRSAVAHQFGCEMSRQRSRGRRNPRRRRAPACVLGTHLRRSGTRASSRTPRTSRSKHEPADPQPHHRPISQAAPSRPHGAADPASGAPEPTPSEDPTAGLGGLSRRSGDGYVGNPGRSGRRRFGAPRAHRCTGTGRRSRVDRRSRPRATPRQTPPNV